MSVESGFFGALYDAESGKYDREYSSEQFMELFSLFFTNGIFLNYKEEFAVVANGGMNIVVSPGFAFIDGAWLKNSDNYEVTIVSNTSATTRYDGIFLKKSLLDRACTIEYRAGDIVPSQSDVTIELLLCKISVPSGATSITQTQITDMRPTEQCGFVGGAVQQLSVSELYAQFTEQFTQWMEGEQNRFDAWFEGIKGQLSEDAAGNLQIQIHDLDSDFTEFSNETTSKFDNLFMYDETTGELVIRVEEV